MTQLPYIGLPPRTPKRKPENNPWREFLEKGLSPHLAVYLDSLPQQPANTAASKKLYGFGEGYASYAPDGYSPRKYGRHLEQGATIPVIGRKPKQAIKGLPPVAALNKRLDDDTLDRRVDRPYYSRVP